MRSFLGSIVVAVLFVACAGSETVIVVSGDGGTSDASTSSCTAQPDTDRALFCGAATDVTFVKCNEGTTPPGSSCTKSALANTFCCATEATTTDAGTKDAPSGADVNPYGIPYPTDHIGTNPRSGATRGDRVQNLSFQGYRPASSTLGTVSLAALYDPQGKTHDVVFLVGGTLWSIYDQSTLDAIKASSERIATFAVLGEGTSAGQAATLTNLSAFRTKNTFATTALDSGFAKLGVFFDAAAVPFVMVIDARTMEIASASVGGLTSVSQVDAAVAAVTSRAAAY